MRVTDRRLPQRVLMTADAVGGVWTYAIDLARALSERQIEVTLAVLGPEPRPDQHSEAAGIPALRIAVCPGRLEWMEDPWEDVATAGRWLLRLARDCRPDVVHLNGYVHAALPWDVPVLVAAHSCVSSWWRAVKKDGLPVSRHTYAAAVRRGLSRADIVVAPSAAMLNALREHYGLLPQARVIWNGRTVPESEHLPKEPLILSAGRLWDAAKNVEAVCACAQAVAWPVYVAGEGGECAESAAQWLGRLSAAEVRHWMQRASIYASPARYEPFGLSILEAAQVGCALVLGDVPSLREIWGDAAIYVGPDDRRALTDALSSLIDSPLLRTLMARRAYQRAALFTVDRMAQAYVEAYSHLLEARVAS